MTISIGSITARILRVEKYQLFEWDYSVNFKYYYNYYYYFEYFRIEWTEHHLGLQFSR